ncbi:MAG: histidine kinase [Bacteroidota bacterium]
MKLLRIQILILMLCVGVRNGTGQEIKYEQFTTEDGLPSMKVYNVCEDGNGVLWMGTENGLTSYDGEEFIRYSHPDLFNNDIIKIEVDREGRVYFLNLNNQLGYIHNNEIQLIEVPEEIETISNLSAYNDKIYITSDLYSKKKIYALEEPLGGSFEFEPTEIYYAIPCLKEDRFVEQVDSTMVYYKVEEDIFNGISGKGILVSEKGDMLASEGKVWIQSFYVYPIDFTVFNYLNEGSYRRIVPLKDDFFIVKSQGAAYYNSSTKSFFPFFNDTRINTIFIDSEDNAWVSTAYKGLFKISNLIQKLKRIDVAIDIGVNDIFQFENGKIALGTTLSKLITDPLDKAKVIRLSDIGRPVGFVSFEGKTVAFDEGGIVQLDENGLIKKRIKVLFSGPKSIQATKGFAMVLFGSGIKKVSLEEFFDTHFKSDRRVYPNYRINDTCEPNGSGKFYMGSTTGLVYYANDEINNVDNKELQSVSISSLTEGPDTSLWIGTMTNGIYQFRNDSILNHYTTKNGLVSNAINNLEISSNELLISTNQGLNIINLDTNKIKTVSTYNFLSSNEVLVCKVIEDDYWIGTIDGLDIISREEVYSSEVRGPKLSLKSLYASGLEVNYTESMTFDHTVNNIQLNFRNISHKSGNDKFIRYRIPTIDTSWAVTKDLNVRLPSLKPGKYQVEALGVNAIGVTGNQLNLSFQINPPWWKTLWAQMLGFLILVIISFLILKVRIRQEKQKLDYLTQINDIKDQALQLQMNPHFIFNSLNAIQGFIGTDDEEMAMNYLARFARLIRLIFEHSKGNTITLEEELEFINLYLDLEKLRFKNRIEVELRIDVEIEQSKDLIRVPPLLIQPIIENSFKHGLFHKKGVGNLKIDFSVEDDLLKIVVEDDGVGRKMSQKINAKNSEKHVSSGINTTMERLNLLNFNTEDKRNDFSIEDLYHENGEAAGTRINLNLVIDTKR